MLLDLETRLNVQNVAVSQGLMSSATHWCVAAGGRLAAMQSHSRVRAGITCLCVSASDVLLFVFSGK